MRKCIAYFCLILDLIQAASDTLIPQANPVDMPLSSRDLTRDADRLKSYFRTLNSIKVRPSELIKGPQNGVDLLVDNEKIHVPPNQKGIDSVTKIHLDRGKLQRYLDILDLESATKPVTIQLDPSRIMNYVKILNDISRSTSQPNGLIYKSRIKMMTPSPILGADGKERLVGHSANQNDLSSKGIGGQRNLRDINPADVNPLSKYNENIAVNGLYDNDEKSNIESDIYYSDDNNDQQTYQIKNNYRKVFNDIPLSEQGDNEMPLSDDVQYEDNGDMHYDSLMQQEDNQNGMQNYYVGEENQKSLCPEGESSPLRDISNKQLNEPPKPEQSIGCKTSNSDREQDKGSDYIFSKDKTNIRESNVESKNLNKAGEYFHSIPSADVSLKSSDQSLIQPDSYVGSAKSEDRIDSHTDVSNQSLNQLKESNISLQVNFSIPISGVTPASLVTYPAKESIEVQSHMRSELSPSLKDYSPKNSEVNTGNNQVKILGLPTPQPILSKPAEFNLSKTSQDPFGQLTPEKIPIGITNKEMVQIRNESTFNKGEPYLDQTNNARVVPMVGTSSPMTALSETNVYRSINVENSKSGIMNNTGLFVGPVQNSFMPSGGNHIPQESVKRHETNMSSSINTHQENVLPSDLTRMPQNDVIVLNETANNILPDQKVFQSQALSANESNQSGMASRTLSSKNASLLIEQEPGKTVGDWSSDGGREQPLTKENNMIQNKNSNLLIKGTEPKERTMFDKNPIFHVEAGHPVANISVVTENKSNMPLMSNDQSTMNRQVKKIEETFNSSANDQRVIPPTLSSFIKEESRTNETYGKESHGSVPNAHIQTSITDQQKSYYNNTSQEFVSTNEQKKNLLPAVNERPVQNKAILFEKPSSAEILSPNESNPNFVLTKPVQKSPQLVINSGNRSPQTVIDQQESTKTGQITTFNKGQNNLTEANFQKGQEESNFIKNTNTTMYEPLKTSKLQIPLDKNCFNGHNLETKPQISPSSDSAKESSNVFLDLKHQPQGNQKPLPNFNTQIINDQGAQVLHGNGQNVPSVITNLHSQSNTSSICDLSKYEIGSKASLQFPEINQDSVATRQQINITNDINTNPLASNDLSPFHVVSALNKNSGNSIEASANTAVKITSDIYTNSSSSRDISNGNEEDVKQIQIPRQIGTCGNLRDSVSLECSHSAHDVLPLQPTDEISDIRNLGGLSRFLETDNCNFNKAGELFYKPTKPPFMFDEYYQNFINKLKKSNKLTDNTRIEGTNENEILTILNTNLEHIHPDKGVLCKIIGKALISEDKYNEQKLLPKWIVEKYDDVDRVFHRGQTQFEPPAENSRKNSEVSEPIYPRAMDKWKEKRHSSNRRSINFFNHPVTTDNEVTQIKTEYPGKGQNVNILFPSNS